MVGPAVDGWLVPLMAYLSAVAAWCLPFRREGKRQQKTPRANARRASASRARSSGLRDALNNEYELAHVSSLHARLGRSTIRDSRPVMWDARSRCAGPASM